MIDSKAVCHLVFFTEVSVCGLLVFFNRVNHHGGMDWVTFKVSYKSGSSPRRVCYMFSWDTWSADSAVIEQTRCFSSSVSALGVSQSGKHERNVCFVFCLLGFSDVLWGQISETMDWLQIAAAVQKQLVNFCAALTANEMLCAQCPTCHAWNIQYAWIAPCCHSCGQVSRISARVVSRGLFFFDCRCYGGYHGACKADRFATLPLCPLPPSPI